MKMIWNYKKKKNMLNQLKTLKRDLKKIIHKSCNVHFMNI